MIAVNFSDKATDIAINIPRLAFDMYGIQEGKRTATELLSGRRQNRTLSSTVPFLTALPPWGAVVWKMK